MIATRMTPAFDAASDVEMPRVKPVTTVTMTAIVFQLLKLGLLMSCCPPFLRSVVVILSHLVPALQDNRDPLARSPPFLGTRPDRLRLADRRRAPAPPPEHLEQTLPDAHETTRRDEHDE